ncbi:MAG: hypothetical protein ETSY1_28650 [Candidatus Entotheonella factor]|uniref:Uncharacterized protein n=1 Tax=Entotheonella factor TaxID=1429438 RepID=W4LCW9_ENTF1|nr:MAG: hypothetical protein ETSY1_28650 [Candidatus Entotheonella factor]
MAKRCAQDAKTYEEKIDILWEIMMNTWMVAYILVTMACGCLALGLGAIVMAPQPKSTPL